MSTDIIFSREGNAGRVLLNRPKVLNALNHKMIIQLKNKLESWSKDNSIKLVIIEGAGEKALCAGGDIRALYDSRPNNQQFVARFYADEYLLNMTIKSFPKPYVSVMDGIVMGGGVGVTVPGSHRIVTERTICAMPETGIGLIPDVGSTYFLARAPKHIGTYIGLTGTKMNASDTIYAGFADHTVQSKSLPTLLEELSHGNYENDIESEINSIISSYKTIMEPSKLEPLSFFISNIFSNNSIEKIITGLKNHDSKWSRETLDTLNKKSPTSLKLSLRAIKGAEKLCFNDCIKIEYRVVLNIMKGSDIYEGIRALIVEKDNRPQWQPNSLEDVTDNIVNDHFQLFTEEELPLL